VEAFGLRKCPKLVEQCQAEDIVVRVNALSVLCDEFLNPSSIRECCKANAVQVLSAMINHTDYLCRFRSSKALALAAEDANGLASIIQTGAIPTILTGIVDPSQEVRANVIQCMYHCSRTAAGVDAVVAAGTVSKFVEIVSSEEDGLKPKLLVTIESGCKTEEGLAACLATGGVKVVVDLLGNSTEDVVAQAAKSLGFLCFSETAKEQAIGFGAIKQLVGQLAVRSRDLRVACTTALMAITSTDEGKRQMADCGGATAVATVLGDQDLIVKMNALKVIANIAVHPVARKELLEHESCASMMTKMAGADGDKRLQKHAKIALDAVQWRP
jgi:hypothetical protein